VFSVEPLPLPWQLPEFISVLGARAKGQETPATISGGTSDTQEIPT
jgi:hypothetical protein